MEVTQHTPADVRGRIIRASILPIEDEETMIARLRAGAEAVERGELDAEDFAGIWSQYLRELFRRASSVPTPADVRERVDVPGLPDGRTPLTGVFTTHHAGRPHAIVLWQGAPWLVWQHPDGLWVTEAKVQVLALLRTPRGEGEAMDADEMR